MKPRKPQYQEIKFEELRPKSKLGLKMKKRRIWKLKIGEGVEKLYEKERVERKLRNCNIKWNRKF